MSSPEQLRIAIIGAGIAGLAAAIELQKHPGIDVHIYERASGLSEVGASIALGPNGMRALERLGVHEALSDGIAFRNQSGHSMIYRHWKTNEVVSVDHHRGKVDYLHRTSRYYRPRLQQILLSHVDSSRLHLRKIFSSVKQAENSLLVDFQDGSSALADILLGADGIHSAVRRYFVPTSAPSWTGWVAFRAVFPAKLVEHIDGVLDEASHWWGPDRTFFASRLGKDLFTIVGGNYSDPDAPDALYKEATWNSDGDLNVLKDFYKDWHPSVRQMIEATPNVRMYPNTYAAGLQSWVHGKEKVTFAGDAAHAHGGAFAAGGSLALDDAWAFVTAIKTIYPEGSAGKPSSSDIARALRLYERTRKAHTDRVLKTVHDNNRRLVERLGQKETDMQLRQRMSNRSDPFWIHEHDVQAAFAEAVAYESRELQARL